MTETLPYLGATALGTNVALQQALKQILVKPMCRAGLVAIYQIC